jgi:ABC-2 type transport system permease protein
MDAQSQWGYGHLLYLSPVMLIVPLVENAGVATLLTILPFTSLLSVSIRNMFMQIPAWQILLSIAVQSLCALMAVWIAVRAFRLGMLRYGQQVRLKEVFSKTRAKSAMQEVR